MRRRLHGEEPTPGLCSWCQRRLEGDEGRRVRRGDVTHFACEGCWGMLLRQRAADKAPREDTVSSAGSSLGPGWVR